MIRAPTVDHQSKWRGDADARNFGECRPKTEPHFLKNAVKNLVACLLLCAPRCELFFACFIGIHTSRPRYRSRVSEEFFLFVLSSYVYLLLVAVFYIDCMRLFLGIGTINDRIDINAYQGKRC